MKQVLVQHLVGRSNVCDNRAAAVDLPFVNALSEAPRSSHCYIAIYVVLSSNSNIASVGSATE